MRKLTFTFLLYITALMSAQNVENYLKTENVINFDKQDFNLVWSTHPNDVYYKQEYLTKEQLLDNFNFMITIDFLEGDFKVNDLVKQKIEALENAKKLNPIINYSVFEKGSDIILDFLTSVSSEDGKKLEIVERNIYRYSTIKNKKANGLVLFSVSQRAYGNDIEAFLKTLKTDKNSLIVKVLNVEIPEISTNK